MAIIEELPFSYTLAPDQPYASLPLPHCAGRIPVGLRVDKVDDGVLLCDLRWSSFSQFAATGNVDPKLLSRVLRVRFHPPKFPRDPQICLGNISRKSAEISGAMLVESAFRPPPIYILPFNPQQPGFPYPWQYDLQPGNNQVIARSQVPGKLKELVLQPAHVELVRAGDLEVTVQSIRYLHPTLKRNVITEMNAIEFTLSSIDRMVFKPRLIPTNPPHEICITLRNTTSDVIAGFSCVATIECEEEPVS